MVSNNDLVLQQHLLQILFQKNQYQKNAAPVKSITIFNTKTTLYLAKSKFSNRSNNMFSRESQRNQRQSSGYERQSKIPNEGRGIECNLNNSLCVCLSPSSHLTRTTAGHGGLVVRASASKYSVHYRWWGFEPLSWRCLDSTF